MAPLTLPDRSRVAVVLGSGLGAVADQVERPQVFHGTGIPGYPAVSTDGHEGRVFMGMLGEREVVVIQGRVHLYEGLTARQATFPVRLAHRLGARSIVITCGAGGIACRAGSLMFMTGHMRMGPTFPLGAKGCGAPYDVRWVARAQRAAASMGIATQRGTIVWTLGPNYETKAEIRYFSRYGAHAVGMSTIPEVLEARRLGMSVLGLALITNAACGLSEDTLSHEEVLACGAQMATVLEVLVPEIVRQAPYGKRVDV